LSPGAFAYACLRRCLRLWNRSVAPAVHGAINPCGMVWNNQVTTLKERNLCSIFYFHDSAKGRNYEETNVFDYITRKDIAEMSGMSSESAIRLLTEFKNDGLIITDGKRLEINNLELLNRLSEVG
jgi:hypothetical protein